MKRISIIIPCRNEEKTIAQVLQAVHNQDYPVNLLEVILADGHSTDRTIIKINEFANSYPDLTIKIVNNTNQTIPSGLNLAIRASSGEVIVRMDAHSLPKPDYVSRCVQGLVDGKGENVGGKWEILPGSDTWVARGIACAAAHPLGVGDARYRISGEAGSVDTVPFGSYYRDLFDRIGFFDETLLTNEDYELNARIRQNRGIVWFDPEIQCQYYSRSTFKELASQYWRYGYWKAKMAKRYPQTLKPRQILPPLFVAGIILLSGLSVVYFPVILGLLIVFFLYVGIIILASIPNAFKRKDATLAVGIPLAIATMHFSWGSGFLYSLVATTK